MRPALFSAVLAYFLASPVCFASQTSMYWWNNNGDSVVLDGVTISLSGSGIQQTGGAAYDPPGVEDATFVFTFNPPIESFQMYVRSVAPWESIQFQSPFPTSVDSPGLVTEGTPIIQAVRGFFQGDSNEGFITWSGPGLTSVTFSMAYADGSIEITQMGQAFPSYFEDSFLIDATPATNGVLLNMAISDAGAVPEVQGFVIERSALYPCSAGTGQLVHCITSRQPGTVSHLTILDTNDVRLDTQYVYRVLGWSSIPCFPDADPYYFQQAFDPTGWGFEIVSFVSTGVEPVPIAHGRIVSVPGEGLPFVQVEPCEHSGCSPYTYGWGAQDVLQYCDTGTEVLVYGSIYYAGNAYGYTHYYTAAEPKNCTISVQPVTWSQLKQLYHDPVAGQR